MVMEKNWKKIVVWQSEKCRGSVESKGKQNIYARDRRTRRETGWDGVGVKAVLMNVIESTEEGERWRGGKEAKEDRQFYKRNI